MTWIVACSGGAVNSSGAASSSATADVGAGHPGGEAVPGGAAGSPARRRATRPPDAEDPAGAAHVSACYGSLFAGRAPHSGTEDGEGRNGPERAPDRRGLLVIGVGSARGASADEIGELIDETLAATGLDPQSVRCVATVDRKAGEHGILHAARDRGWNVVAHPAADLAVVAVPHPSSAVSAATGTPSVAEAAALLEAAADGGTAMLVVPKHRSARATIAIARTVPSGHGTTIGASDVEGAPPPHTTRHEARESSSCAMAPAGARVPEDTARSRIAGAGIDREPPGVLLRRPVARLGPT